MFELMLCSSLTVLPDYLFRRYVQGKRIGYEINFFSVWYELRWGITTCMILTISLITMIFYFHPSTRNAVSLYRTIPILAEGIGRVTEVKVTMGQEVKAGDELFKMDSREQDAALETARKRVAEVDATIMVKQTELASADGKIQEARSSLQQAIDELETKTELFNRDSGTVSRRDLERLQNVVEGREGGLSAAIANKQNIEVNLSTLLPAQKQSAEAALQQAQVEIDKLTVYAGVDGKVEQFALKVGDIVNPLSRAAGVLVPATSGQRGVLAGFGQIEAQVMRPGMPAELACIARPFEIIPMVVTEVQDVIATGQVRPTDALIDLSQSLAPGTITAVLEPIFEGSLENLPPGSNCIANAYTNNHEKLASGELSSMQAIGYHVIDGVGLVHAMLLRIQAILMPIQTLVLKGH
jgi:multidrug resistance efflux pump